MHGEYKEPGGKLVVVDLEEGVDDYGVKRAVALAQKAATDRVRSVQSL